MENKRRVEKLINNVFEPVEWEKLEKGDTIRIFEPDGTPVRDELRNTEFITVSPAHVKTIDGVDYWSVQVEETI